MSVAQIRGVALFKRNKWRRELDENKIDMGMIEAFSSEELNFSLYTAVVENNHRAIKEMVEAGADTNMSMPAQDGMPAGMLLHFAARQASLKSVIALLQLGADPFAKDEAGLTPRDVAQDRLSGSRMRTVLKLWEQRKLRPAMDDNVIPFESLVRTGS